MPLFVESAEQNLKEYEWQVLFVNDGSHDGSWDAITAAHERNPRVKGLCFARNFGHQNALKAGMEEAWKDHHADVYVTLDADLQHPIEFIPQMVQAWQDIIFPKIHLTRVLRHIQLAERRENAARYVGFPPDRSWRAGVCGELP